MGEWKNAWATARKAAGLHYRWHDLRHTFVSRLAENPHVSEQTIMALAGPVSKKMLARYSHIRTHAERAAIAALEGGVGTESGTLAPIAEGKDERARGESNTRPTDSKSAALSN